MCGIFFYKGTNVNKILDYLIKASNTIKPRGPEKTTTIYTDNYFLSFHRLAINNVSNECNQPFIYHEHNFTYYVMCNGEIYNWKRLLQSPHLLTSHIKNDCSIIFPLFKHLNYDFNKLCNTLEGEFAITIVQIDNTVDMVHNIWSSVDICSVRPLFQYNKDNFYMISSLLSGITTLASVLDLKDGVKRINGGEIYTYSLIKSSHIYELSKSTYTNILDKKESYFKELDILNTKEQDYYSKIVNNLRSCVYKRLDDTNTSRGIGCLLSGGLDSSLVAALAAEYLRVRGKRLVTYSIGMKGGTDLAYAKKVADHIGSVHIEVLFTPEQGLQAIDDVIRCTETYDITTIRASVGQYLLAKWISENSDKKVILNGDGADECQMGYMYFYKAPDSIQAAIDSQRLIREIHYFDGLRVDRNISHFGLEARVPYLDKEFVQLFQSIPPKYKVPSYKNCEKYLIRKAFETVYADNPILPDDVLWRRKEAFSDGVSSTEKSWFEIINEYIATKQVKTIDCFFNSPYTTESTYYRQKFNEYFTNDVAEVIPHFWLPSWTEEKDPSARKLDNYKK
jgi:asparagine synthase (glutamine-hydrolysing)